VIANAVNPVNIDRIPDFGHVKDRIIRDVLITQALDQSFDVSVDLADFNFPEDGTPELHGSVSHSYLPWLVFTESFHLLCAGGSRHYHFSLHRHI